VAVPTGNTYDKYGTPNPIERRLVGTFFDRLESLLPTEAPARILEVGAGEGVVAARVAARFPLATMVTLDLDAALPSTVVGDACRLPFPMDSFDLVLAVEVLEHLPAPDIAIDEMARVARPGATAILSVPSEPLWRAMNLARGKYVGDLGNTPGHLQHWTPTAFRRLVSRRFEVQVVRRPIPWTLLAAVRPGR
jgi:ubiquinone/menaquinone biosynthesis C-methylase UbiE